MCTLGVDIGSRTIKTVLVDEGRVLHSAVRDTSFDPLHVCLEMVSPHSYDDLVVTGYGRRLFARHWPEARTITEIKAVATGARHLFPDCRTVIDIGGQDTKVVSLDPLGNLSKFVMNDRCAAGTGRFLEVIARALSLGYEEMVAAGLAAKRSENLSSMCTVFAETEVVSLVARGAKRDEIALGLHRAIAKRTSALALGTNIEHEIVFTGGGARNECLHQQLAQTLNRPLTRPEKPEIVAALGAAL